MQKSFKTKSTGSSWPQLNLEKAACTLALAWKASLHQKYNVISKFMSPGLPHERTQGVLSSTSKYL